MSKFYSFVVLKWCSMYSAFLEVRVSRKGISVSFNVLGILASPRHSCVTVIFFIVSLIVPPVYYRL